MSKWGWRISNQMPTPNMGMKRSETNNHAWPYCHVPAGRKSNKPNSNIITEANNNKVKVLDETEYKYLQSLGDFDLKSSSWILTPMEIRKLGGALFGDKKYNRTFIYHNGAESYYSNRGFRVLLKI